MAETAEVVRVLAAARSPAVVATTGELAAAVAARWASAAAAPSLVRRLLARLLLLLCYCCLPLDARAQAGALRGQYECSASGLRLQSGRAWSFALWTGFQGYIFNGMLTMYFGQRSCDGRVRA